MNLIYFNTGCVDKFQRLSLKDEIESACEKFTRVLIDEYIQPKRIVAMGREPFDNLKNKSIEKLKQGEITIEKSYRNDIPIYFIPNPSRINRHRYANGKDVQYRQFFEKEFL
jgi:uracil-DNA glycosylase